MVGIVAVLVAASGGSSLAQCPANPQGGPSVLEITTPTDGTGTDFDLGTKGTLHDAILPGLKLDVCLSGCGAGANPVCTIDEIRPDPSSPGLAPPIPVNQSGLLLCAGLAFPTPTPSATGTANVQSGDITLQTTLQMRFFYGNSPSSICPECVTGTCSFGANDGGSCQVDASVVAGAKTFALSHSCQPSGSLLATRSIPVAIKTATATQGACTNQSSTDMCTPTNGTCGTSGCTQGASGITQECCSMLGTRSCFPPSGVTRTGAASAPAPAWGVGSQYPKTASETLVNASCAWQAAP